VIIRDPFLLVLYGTSREVHGVGRSRARTTGGVTIGRGAIVLFRYQLIREGSLIQGTPPNTVAGWCGRSPPAEHTDPFGRRVRVSRQTLDRWIRDWRAGGVRRAGAQPAPDPSTDAGRGDGAGGRVAGGRTRIAPPRRSAGSCAPNLGGPRTNEPCNATSNTRIGLTGPSAASTVRVFGRFEAARPNELWTGDALHGPGRRGRKTYLFAFVDAHSRALVGYRFGYAEDTVRLAAALRPALASRGSPKRSMWITGQRSWNAWLLPGVREAGHQAHPLHPGRPQGRGKIERLFRTVRDQFLVEITGDPDVAGRHFVADLTELNRLFAAWAETVYHRPPRIRDRATTPDPLERQRAVPTALTRGVGRGVLWEERRTVTKTATISLHGTPTRSMPVWSDGRWSWCSTHST